jgi:hypothetical protein
MKKDNKSSRRSFLKSTALVSGGLLGSSLYAYNTNVPLQSKEEGIIHFSLPSDLESTNLKVSGLLFSQIGYNLGQTARIVIRMPEKNLLSEEAVCKLIPNDKENKYQAQVNYWGELWKSHWWVVEFTNIKEEGPLWFTGLFHGTNTIYGYTAALALKLSKLFYEPILKEIAIGNLQWVAGLNAGVTKGNLKASVVYSEDIPEDIALPSSMICDIGNKSAGTWFRTRGVVCNGFSTGTQFVMDVDPTKENDGPFSFTDEDWIPHSAAWLTGLMKLNKSNT